jgi:hypothetical protein
MPRCVKPPRSGYPGRCGGNTLHGSSLRLMAGRSSRCTNPRHPSVRPGPTVMPREAEQQRGRLAADRGHPRAWIAQCHACSPGTAVPIGQRHRAVDQRDRVRAALRHPPGAGLVRMSRYSRKHCRPRPRRGGPACSLDRVLSWTVEAPGPGDLRGLFSFRPLRTAFLERGAPGVLRIRRRSRRRWACASHDLG